VLDGQIEQCLKDVEGVPQVVEHAEEQHDIKLAEPGRSAAP
jgi:hypothetical protein